MQAFACQQDKVVAYKTKWAIGIAQQLQPLHQIMQALLQALSDQGLVIVPINFSGSELR
jgi:hypothetical protein